MANESTESNNVSNMNRDGLLARTLGLQNNSHGPISKIVNVIGRVAVVYTAVTGAVRLFTNNEEEGTMPEAVGAYEPK